MLFEEISVWSIVFKIVAAVAVMGISLWTWCAVGADLLGFNRRW